jgi:hypothetical protein
MTLLFFFLKRDYSAFKAKMTLLFNFDNIKIGKLARTFNYVLYLKENYVPFGQGVTKKVK